ncbi:TonB-dependent receptor [Sphingobium fuliginis]|uniref:Outer membrane receptor protein n=1 Tax=Sphingobium fuliginis (strain ATCC 27551) TaxID=336203 RepID=A0A292ZL87_SPHSA|nr:TonB-dependent receptor [Sphingobium fuliginis]GAY23724.1 outer membrane receptor protein [Sphingobium fuliginis]
MNGKRHLARRMPRLALLAGLCLPAMAAAQDDAGSAGIQDIVVTAQKRAENVQDIPIAINALGGEALAERRIADPTDLVRQFPNLSFKQSSAVNAGISIRGVGTQNFHLTAQQAVGQYLDEVSLVTPFSSTFGLFDLERVEILRGPQNTLFGRNTTGGAINYVSRRPDAGEGFNGYARINAGRFNRIDVEGAIGLPLTDTLAIRVAGQVQTRDGVFRDVATGEKIGSTKRYSGRFGIGWQPDDDTELLLAGHVGYNRGSRPPRKAVGRFLPDGVTPCPANDLGVEQFERVNNCVSTGKGGLTFNPSLSRWRDAYDAGSNLADVDFEGGSLRLRHDFGGFSLTAISAFDRTKVLYAEEGGGLPYAQFQVFQDALYDVYSQEVRLTSGTDGPLKWIAGAYWSYEKDSLATIVRNNFAGPPTLAVVPMVAIDQKAEIASFYGQLDYALTDRLDISAGLRWTNDRRQGLRDVITALDSVTGLPGAARLPADFFFSRGFLTGLAANFTLPCAAGVVGCHGPLTPLKQDVSKLAGKISVNYELATDVMAYLSYSRGFKSGSFDIRAQGVFNGTGNTPVRPETLNAYELGLKSRLFDRRVQMNVAAFRYDWKDLQTFGQVPVLGPAFINLPKARLTGVEAEAKIAPGGGFELDLAGAFLDTEVIDVGALTPQTALKGAPLQQSPRWSFNGTASQTVELGDNRLTGRLSGRYVGAQYNELTKARSGYIDPSFFVDASIGFDFGRDRRHQISFYADNLTSEKTCLRKEPFDGLSNTNTCVPNEGTVLYGVTLSTRW